MNAKIMTRLSVFAVAGALLAGCATQQQNNAAVGTGAGAALGAGLGAIFGGGKGAAIGAGVGALAGGITGYKWQAIRDKISGASKGTGTTVNEQGDGSLKVNIPATDAFAINSAQISSSLGRTLDEVANQMRQNPELVADVRGYTDITGGSELNQRLSQSRADAVANYLSQRGVAPNRLASRGFGPADPVGDNNTEQGRAANRRVEIYLKATAQPGQPPRYQ